MTIGTITSIIVLLVLLVIFLGLARQHRRLTPRLPKHPIRKTPTVQFDQLQASGKYRGVKIESHCSSSSNLVGREYEFDTAPTLPLRDCKAAVCLCSYIGLPERRKTPDRRAWRDRRASIRPGTDDRRAPRPRRKADLSAWAVHGNL